MALTFTNPLHFPRRGQGDMPFRSAVIEIALKLAKTLFHYCLNCMVKSRENV
jgi:hypothetical protein